MSMFEWELLFSQCYDYLVLILLVDIVDFVDIVDWYGCYIGDWLLWIFFECICDKICESDLFGCIDGVQFLLVLLYIDFNDVLYMVEGLCLFIVSIQV